MSPVMAAACAIVGKLADVRKLAGASNIASAKAEPQISVEDPVQDDVSTDEDLDRVMDVTKRIAAIFGA